MIDNSKNQVFFRFSCDNLTPTLETRNSVLHRIRYDNGVPSPRTLYHLEALQQKVDKAIDLEEKRWSFHLAEEIHNISFNPKGAWENIKLLMGFGTLYHTDLRLIQMRLLSGRLAENEEDKVSVFVSHF